MPKIRQLSIKDLSDLQTISREIYFATFISSISAEDIAVYMEEAYSKEVLGAELQSSDSDFYFLESETGDILGYVKLNVGPAQTEDVAANAMEIQRIYVRPNQKRKGYGHTLMKFSLDAAREKGCDSVWLGVWEYNTIAQDFYKSHGFVKVGEHVFITGNQEDTDHILLKKLD
ncbi:GNAT family N-acetyltransferase [Streptococcus sp. X16XC17]|uniref:GNAT family N-acetyltransferase n=1 Tax=unclassified Streptococcus TaxID=2608887 RepID=UPI00066FD223|nr:MULTISPECIES: GNAT family N-acetyltransferase [unclassified Streptococcus]TCD45784.1 GNAT family N-acetyltransferase [Streptococcus sp. X16XC17]